MLEGQTALGFLAAHTRRARLGLMVGGIHYRDPGLWIKATTTLDVLYGGRAWFGIGAAWNVLESKGLGFPFPSLKERFEWLEDTLQMANEMWSGGSGTGEAFTGRHVTATHLINSPQSISRPRVPILVGGGGERKTLRLVAQYADACNLFGRSPEFVRDKLAVLREHCERLGRPYEAIRRTSASVCIFGDTDEEARAALPPGSEFAFPGDLAGYGLIGTPETIRRRLAAYEAAGVQELAISFGGPDPLATLRRYAAEIMRTSTAPSRPPAGTAARS